MNSSPFIAKTIKHYVKLFLFQSKWILPFFYAGLVLGLGIYCYTYCVEIYHLIRNFTHLDSEDTMLALLQLVDVSMVANLIRLIITGSYLNFVEKSEDGDHDTEHVSSGGLKIKMFGSIIGITGIHMLQDWLTGKFKDFMILVDSGVVLILFIITILALAHVEYLYNKTKH